MIHYLSLYVCNWSWRTYSFMHSILFVKSGVTQSGGWISQDQLAIGRFGCISPAGSGLFLKFGGKANEKGGRKNQRIKVLKEEVNT